MLDKGSCIPLMNGPWQVKNNLPLKLKTNDCEKYYVNCIQMTKDYMRGLASYSPVGDTCMTLIISLRGED